MNQKVQVFTYDSSLNPLPARLKYKCLNSDCEIGSTKLTTNGAEFYSFVPECINGFFVASKEGYLETKYQVSTNKETVVDIILPKIYKINLDFGKIPGNAVIYFNGEKHSSSAIYPEMKSIDLVEDNYNITVYLYQNSSITLDGITQEKCVDVPTSGVGSIFGVTEEKCNTVNIPSMNIDSALVGGGKTINYFTEDELKKSSELNIQVPIFYTPKSIEDLQANYVLIEDSKIYVNLE
jgi:hypothetical protein